MKKYLFYLMQGEKMCALHALMNADALAKDHEVKIIFEGQAVKLPAAFEKDQLPLYMKLKKDDCIAGICRACSKALGVLEEVEKLEVALLDDMNGHAGIKSFIDQGYDVLVF